MKKNLFLVFTLSLSASITLLGQTEEPEVIPRGKLTIINRSENGCYFWFAGYIEKGGKPVKQWHPNYNPEKKTVKPLILYPGQAAEITILDEECFYRMYAWWGKGYKKIDERIKPEHRCRNVTLEMKGDRNLELDYSIELTEKEIEDQKKAEEEKKKKEEEAEAEVSSEEEDEGVKEKPKSEEKKSAPKPEPEPEKKKRGLWV